MTRQKHAIDGFVPRRAGAPLEGLPKSEIGLPSVQTVAMRREVGEHRPMAQASEAAKRPAGGISRSEIDESLKGIDEPEQGHQKRKKRFSRFLTKKLLKRIVLLLIIIAIGIGAYVGFRTLMASNRIFKGNVFDILQSQPLKMDANGRTNIIVLGTSEDDPGHEGANLTDSMMILSVDQNKKNAYMISIPRDMQVKYGELCSVGSSGKINAYFFSCAGAEDPKNVETTQAALKKTGDFIGDIFGLDIHYGANVNYSVMRDLVNAVGGSITVTIESRDPRGQMDSNFDWKCGVGDRKVSRAEVLRRCPPNGHFIDYKNGPVTLDAEHALYLAQARGDLAPTYGFEQSNFDREKNQQKIVKALREKAFSAGVLSDFGKVAGIIDALGNNLRTTFETKEIRTLVTLAQGIKSEDIKSVSLIDGDAPVMKGDGNPAAGLYQYDAIRAFIKKSISSDPVTQENAIVAVYNGSGVTGAAQAEADKLEELGFVVGNVGNPPAGEYAPATVYQIDASKKATAAKLKKTYGVELLTTDPPVTVPTGTAFVVIIGKAASTSQSAQ